ncbi:MAG: tRNA (N6-isopentenyl adenosine(37)-C2)-methylthiotransferase MiaB, partial [Atopobiaceae bacterium]|nr:tRNA (N6-isopentenyl adenosine(37)-C2)-methylthiotransferase MiaB [Atopobiaceae bacterium]
TELPSHRAQAFLGWVPIMTGCNNFCSYCIVPSVRGRERSRVLERVVDECSSLVESGVREICLLGQNVNSYGRDLYGSPRFAELLRKVGETGVDRIRFTSSNPKDLSDETILAMAETPNVMPHLHLAVQSGSTRILKQMNRSYGREEYLDLVGRIKGAMPDIALSTDIIVGFPGETEEDFEDTLSLVREVSFSSAYTFIYSKREGTPAARIVDDTPREVIQGRFDRLAALVAELAHDANERDLNTVSEVLVEGPSNRDARVLVGHSRKNQTVHFAAPEDTDARDLIGKICDVKVEQARTWYLSGSLVNVPR